MEGQELSVLQELRLVWWYYFNQANYFAFINYWKVYPMYEAYLMVIANEV